MKNAYMIIAHNNYEQLKVLIELLDDVNNDIFIHINSKVELPDLKYLTERINYSKVKFCDRVKLTWGKSGLLEAEFKLLECALANDKYDYYHLLSGSDLPIKTNEDINYFLRANLYNNKSETKKTNYIDLNLQNNPIMKSHVCQYNILIGLWKSENCFVRIISKMFNRVFVYLQMILNINRQKHNDVHQGDAWWSITHELAVDLYEKKDKIFRPYKHCTFAAEEYAIHTYIHKSSFSDTIFNDGKSNAQVRACLRLIDFHRGENGSPYTYTIKDLDEIKSTCNLWCRKFNSAIDNEIIVKIIEMLNRGD